MGTAELCIDLDAVQSNWHALDALSSDAVETGACVKADAYGLGVHMVAGALYSAGVRTFFVAVAEEGIELRDSIGDDARVFVFGGHQAGDLDDIRNERLIPLLNSPEQLWRHLDLCPGLPFGIQLDTGMNRLGMEPADWDVLRDEALAAGPELLMSHLACADEPEHPMNAAQLAAFRDMTDGLQIPRSLAATGGALLGPEYHFDLVRPGIGLYGGLPFEDARAVVELSAPVIQTRRVAEGEPVGYGNSWTAKDDRVVATISAGYADGLHRAIGHGGVHVHANGTACPVIGRISMDLITVDVTALNHVPTSLDILTPQQGIDVLADAAGTIGYEVLTSLGHRYTRAYRGGT